MERAVSREVTVCREVRQVTVKSWLWRVLGLCHFGLSEEVECWAAGRGDNQRG